MEIIQGKTDCSPAEAGYDASRLDAVNAFFERFIEQKVIHGALYCLARHGKVFASAAMGKQHYQKPELLLQPNSVFAIRTVTETFTSVAIQILAEDGLLSIDDKAAKYLPQFDGPPYDRITLIHLLTHTSGLHPDPGVIFDKYNVNYYERIAEQVEKDGMGTDWIAAGLRAGVHCEPGKRWVMSSFGINVLGAIIEKISGLKYTDFIIKRICQPLGMTDTAFTLTPEMADRMTVYDNWGKQFKDTLENGKMANNSIWDTITAPETGLFSTADDLIRFGIMLQNGGVYNDSKSSARRILGRKAVEKMTKLMIKVPNYSFNGKDHKMHIKRAIRYCTLGFELPHFDGFLTSSGTYMLQGSGGKTLIVDPAEELVCVCYYPWVKKDSILLEDDVGEAGWNADCFYRMFNVLWSGII